MDPKTAPDRYRALTAQKIIQAERQEIFQKQEIEAIISLVLFEKSSPQADLS
jgi:hypothetical protein